MSPKPKNGNGKEPAESTPGPVGEGSSPAPTKGASSVLNLSDTKQAEGGGVLRRVIKDKEGHDVIVDFWNDVVRFGSPGLEQLLNVARTDSNYDLTSFIRGIEYQGFDRLFYIKHCLTLMSVSLFCRFAVLGAIRGSNFKAISESCENMPADMINAFASCGFVKTPKKKDHVTILRCTASIPHWCAFYLWKAGVEKKMAVECPPCLQFPGAASLPMSREVRLQHIDFCVRFSNLLPGGSFRISIYLTAMNNMIPVADIPAEVLSILKVASASESHKLTDDEVNQYSKQLAVKR